MTHALRTVINHTRARIVALKLQRRELHRVALVSGVPFDTPALDQSIMDEEIDQMLLESEVLKHEREDDAERQRDELSQRWVRALQKSQWNDGEAS